MAVKPIPDGYHTATPYLVVQGAEGAIDFYKKAFGATELYRMPGPDGRVVHAEIQLGSSRIMLGEECPEMGSKSPLTMGGSPASIVLYVEDVDTRFDHAVASGAKSLRPVEDKFYGDRMGTLEDPFGHSWHLATHKEDVSPAQMQERMAAAMKQAG